MAEFSLFLQWHVFTTSVSRTNNISKNKELAFNKIQPALTEWLSSAILPVGPVPRLETPSKKRKLAEDAQLIHNSNRVTLVKSVETNNIFFAFSSFLSFIFFELNGVPFARSVETFYRSQTCTIFTF
jgi:hypothetical protein